MALSSVAGLLRLLSEAGVPKEMQDKFVEAGAESVQDFAALFRDVDDLHKTAKQELGVDPDASLAQRVQVAKLVVAWQTASARAAKMFGASNGSSGYQAGESPAAASHSQVVQTKPKKKEGRSGCQHGHGA